MLKSLMRLNLTVAIATIATIFCTNNILLAETENKSLKQQIEQLEERVNSVSDPFNKAVYLNNLGVIYAESGRFREAITNWTEASRIFKETNRVSEYIKVNISLSQVLLEQDDVLLAVNTLTDLIGLAEKNQLIDLESFAKLVLANAYLQINDYKKAIELYEADPNFEKNTITLINTSLAYLKLSQQQISSNPQKNLEQTPEFVKAKEIAFKALNLSNTDLRDKISARLNYLQFSSQLEKGEKIKEITSLLNSLSDSTFKGNSLRKLSEFTEEMETRIDLLNSSIETSKKIKDHQTAGIAYLKLSSIYFELKNFKKAQEIADIGMLYSEDRIDSKNVFRFLYLIGNIKEARKDFKGALSSYKRALWHLQNNHGYTIGNNLFYKLRAETQEFLRDYITLLLKENQTDKAIEILSTLKLSEFQAYFNDPCLDFDSNNVKETDLVEGEIKVYSFITPNTTYLLLKKANKINLYPINIKQKKIEELSQRYQQKLINLYSINHQEDAKAIYDILIKPIAKDLVASTKISFINDGILRTIPVGTWYDGEQYLFQKYLIDYSSGLNVPDSTQRKVNRTLIAGSSIFQISDLSPLPGVKNEINFLDKFLGKSLILLDRKFTFEAFLKAISSRRYDTIHVATHGFFGGSVNNSYLATYDRKIDLNEFSGLLSSALRRPFLLFLNGCETAVGNAESPLGIAGVGLRARSANIIASLWDVRDDAAVEFAAEFYRQYKSGKSIAEARREAQLKLFQNRSFQHPSFWGGYIYIKL